LRLGDAREREKELLKIICAGKGTQHTKERKRRKKLRFKGGVLEWFFYGGREKLQTRWMMKEKRF
jgi:hypothetical protein